MNQNEFNDFINDALHSLMRVAAPPIPGTESLEDFTEEEALDLGLLFVGDDPDPSTGCGESALRTPFHTPSSPIEDAIAVNLVGDTHPEEFERFMERFDEAHSIALRGDYVSFPHLTQRVDLGNGTFRVIMPFVGHIEHEEDGPHDDECQWVHAMDFDLGVLPASCFERLGDNPERLAEAKAVMAEVDGNKAVADAMTNMAEEYSLPEGVPMTFGTIVGDC